MSEYVYASAARRYRAYGWWPIPVHGKTIPAAKATGYEGTVTDEKISEWIERAPSVWVSHEDKTRTLELATNITLRHDGTLAIDVDEYGVERIDGREVMKNGVEQLAAFAQKHGLGPLPATWSSTARGAESGSRQYLYRIPENAQLKTKPCPAVELCCWHHRHTVVAPTIHPKLGTMYAWYWPGEPGVPPSWGEATDAVPLRDEVAMLPEDWFAAFQSTGAQLDENARVVAADELVATFVEGDPSGLIRYLLAKWENPATPIDHDIMKTEGINVLMLGRAGHSGARLAWEKLLERYGAYVLAKRPEEYERDLHSSEGIVATVVRIAQQKPVSESDRPRSKSMPQELRPIAGGAGIPELSSATAATREELTYFAQNYTSYLRPDRLGRRTAWMRNDEPSSLPYHAWALVQDVLAGHYPAKLAYKALSEAYTAHGGTDPSGAVQLLSVALGAALDARKVA